MPRTMPDEQDCLLDPALLRRRFGKAGPCAAGADFLAREAASRMIERFDWIRLQPARILDLGCGEGADLPALAARFPQAQCVGLDLAAARLAALPRPGMLDRLLRRPAAAAALCADASALPLRNASVQLVWSNFLLHWLPDPAPALRECHRVLETGGLVMFSTLGPDSLRELREAFPRDTAAHVHSFIDMHDLGDTLLHCGFSDPVMDAQRLTLEYPDAASLFRDLHAASAHNALVTRPRGLRGRAWHTAGLAALERTRRHGSLPLSIELVFGHAWKAPARQLEDGRAIIRFAPR